MCSNPLPFIAVKQQCHDVAVVIGRFQPFHLGHAKLLREALLLAPRVVLVIGSDQKARDPYNPFTSAERIEFIRSSLSEADCERVFFCPIRDTLYSDHRWLASTVNAVQELLAELRVTDKKIPRTPSVALVGNKKDIETKDYIELFKGIWDLHGVECWQSQHVPGRNGELSIVNATEIRKAFFEERTSAIERLVPTQIAKKLENFKQQHADVWKYLVDEYHFYNEYNRQHARREIEVVSPETGALEKIIVNPYGVMFQTVDAVVVQNGHVLLIKRRNSPGKALLALPGGFLKPNETRLDGVVRELREETRIKLPEKVLRGSLRETKGFDHPRRSLRGRTITEAFFFRLDDSNELPGVRGGDDAARASWVPFADLMRRESDMFEDHFHIIEYFLARF